MRLQSLKKLLCSQQNTTTYLGALVSLAFVLRLVVVFFVVHSSDHTIHDTNFGWESWEMGWTARSIYLGNGFSSPFLPMTGPTALVPPLYPYLISVAFRFFGLYTSGAAFAVLAFNSLCSALTCLPLYFLVRNALNTRIARTAALAWAIYPFAVYFSADRIWDYAVTALLFTCCLLIAQRLHLRTTPVWIGFGALYGIAVLSNPSITTIFPCLLLIALYKARHKRAWLGKGLLAVMAFLVVLTPWTIRNERTMHAGFFMRDGFWLEFYAGNNGDTHESNSSYVHPASNPVEMKKYTEMGEIAYMAEKRALSIAFVAQHPGFFAVATTRRIVRFWTGFWSFRPGYLKYEPFDLPNVPFCLFLIFFAFRGLRRWWKHDRNAVLPYAISLLIFPIPYYFTHASMDYRQPIEPVLIVLLTIGIFGLRQGDQDSGPQATTVEAEPSSFLEGIGLSDEPEFALSQGMELSA